MVIYPYTNPTALIVIASVSVASDVVATNGITVNSMWVLGTLAGAGTVITFLFRALISAKDKELAAVLKDKDRALEERESALKSYEEIASEAVRSAKETADFYRNQLGLAPVQMVVPVIPENHSPASPAQREAAHIATLRAKMAAIKVTVGQVPRKEKD